MLINNAPHADEHPRIRDFLEIVGEVANDRPLDFLDLQKPAFSTFWKGMTVATPVDDEFEYLIWGSELTYYYGRDLTGKRMSAGGYGQAEQAALKQLMNDSAVDKKTVYSSGNLDWQGRGHIHWDMVTLPLQRNGEDIAMSFVCADIGEI